MAKKKFYRPILHFFLIGLRNLFSLLPVGVGLKAGGFLGRTAFRVLAKEQKKVLAHLSIAFPHLDRKRLMELGTKNFEHYGITTAELALADKLIPQFDRLISVTGREHFDEALKKGKGLIALTAHFGNWEFLGGSLSLMGYPGSVIARRIYYDKYNALMVALRAKMGLQTLYRDESPKEILKAFKENRVVGILADQDVDSVDGVFVEFFGKPAFTPTAPVKFAMKLGAPLIPLFIIREGRKHRIEIHPPIELTRTGDETRDLVENTQKWVTIQEEYIRQYPHLWVWNHARWKTVPKS